MALQVGNVLNNRYTVQAELGGGGQAQTWRALDGQTGAVIVLKVVTLRTAQSWKAVELWERECQVLRQLRHSAIPEFVDAFEYTANDGDRVYVLVQTLVPGDNLAQHLKAGKRWLEAELRDIARQALEVLAYLHELSPPVVHRDIKPSNLILQPTGQLAVVDFGGATAHLAASPEGGLTMVGTHGYMPAEQTIGHARPESDLYALGATLIHLASGHAPDQLPLARMRIQFEATTQLSQRLEEWLAKLVQPMAEDRFPTARAALDALAQLDVPVQGPPKRPEPPIRSAPVLPQGRAAKGDWRAAVVVVLVVVAAVVFLANSRKIKRWWRGKSVATAYTAPVRTQPARVSAVQNRTLPVRFVNAEFSNVQARSLRAEQDTVTGIHGATLRLTGTIEQSTGKNVDTLIVFIRVFADDGSLLLGERSHLAQTGILEPPLPPGHVQRFQWQTSKISTRAARVEVEVRELVMAGDQEPERDDPVALTVMTALPPGVQLELRLNRLERKGHKPWWRALSLHNRGTAMVRSPQLEMTCRDAAGALLQRGLTSPLRLGFRELPAGSRTRFWVHCPEATARAEFALVQVTAGL